MFKKTIIIKCKTHFVKNQKLKRFIGPTELGSGNIYTIGTADRKINKKCHLPQKMCLGLSVTNGKNYQKGSGHDGIDKKGVASCKIFLVWNF